MNIITYSNSPARVLNPVRVSAGGHWSSFMQPLDKMSSNEQWNRNLDKNMWSGTVVHSERFCRCEDPVSDPESDMTCLCGEELDAHEWEWESSQTSSVQLSANKREVRFHPGYSTGTAAVRGNSPCLPGKHYMWEIKILSSAYGTDIMVGVGTSKVELLKYSDVFLSLLGENKESWGLSYTGEKMHAGSRKYYGPRFGKGSIVGVHLDMWTGKLEFYLNRKPLGVAFRIICNQPLFPMLCSTAKNSAMRLVRSMSWPVSLQLSCLRALPSLPELSKIPGLENVWGNSIWWQLATGKIRTCDEDDDEEMPLEFEIVESDEEELLKKKVSHRKKGRKQVHNASNHTKII